VRSAIYVIRLAITFNQNRILHAFPFLSFKKQRKTIGKQEGRTIMAHERNYQPVILHSSPSTVDGDEAPALRAARRILQILFLLHLHKVLYLKDLIE
jgi:hypothetical protein